eukprot:COSAG05_NODE_818_length_7136_cov_1156.705841_6_plen_55_part_00
MVGMAGAGIYGMMVMMGASGFIILGLGIQPAVYRAQVFVFPPLCLPYSFNFTSY